jgi:hypothetical protein
MEHLEVTVGGHLAKFVMNAIMICTIYQYYDQFAENAEIWHAADGETVEHGYIISGEELAGQGPLLIEVWIPAIIYVAP